MLRICCGGRQQGGEPVAQGRALLRQLLDQGHVRGIDLGCFEPLECAIWRAGSAVDPLIDIGTVWRSAGEVLEVVAACERNLHLGDTLAGLRHVALIGGLSSSAGVVSACPTRLWSSMNRSSEALVSLQASPWFSTKRVDDRLALSRVRPGQFDAAEQGRGVREAGDIGEEASDFDLRVKTILELAIDLDDVAVVDKRGRVGLFGFDGADVFDRRVFDRAQPFRSA